MDPFSGLSLLLTGISIGVLGAFPLLMASLALGIVLPSAERTRHKKALQDISRILSRTWANRSLELAWEEVWDSLSIARNATGLPAWPEEVYRE